MGEGIKLQILGVKSKIILLVKLKIFITTQFCKRTMNKIAKRQLKIISK